MDEYESLSHSKWECKYHVVFIPKCRRKTLYGELRRHLGEVFRKLALQKESQIEEGHLMPDHVHMMISIPPKYAVSQVVGFIKGKSAIHLARVYGEKKRNFVGQHFWARGYFVSTVGRDEAVIRIFDFPIPATVRQNRLLFIHIPKNAGTTVATQLYGNHRGHRTALFHLSSDPAHFRAKRKFAIVRNPWSRVVSAYEFGRAINPNHRPYLAETRHIFQEYRTFSDFVNLYLLENKEMLDSLDPIFRPQFTYVCDKNYNIIVDRIFHFEDLSELSEWAGSC